MKKMGKGLNKMTSHTPFWMCRKSHFAKNKQAKVQEKIWEDYRKSPPLIPLPRKKQEIWGYRD